MATRNCPMCLNPIPFEGDEPAKTCPACGADLSSWRLKYAKAPELLKCPMCESLVPVEGIDVTKTCPRCGADLSRWTLKQMMPAAPVVSAMGVEERRLMRVRSMRAALVIGALLFLLTFCIPAISYFGPFGGSAMQMVVDFFWMPLKFLADAMARFFHLDFWRYVNPLYAAPFVNALAGALLSFGVCYGRLRSKVYKVSHTAKRRPEPKPPLR